MTSINSEKPLENILEPEGEKSETSQEARDMFEDFKKLTEGEFKKKYGTALFEFGLLLEEKSKIDSTSGLLQKRFFMDMLNELIEKEMGKEETTQEIAHSSARMSGDEFAMFIKAKGGETVVIYGDLAYLSLFNEPGHWSGDLVIRAVGDAIKVAEEEIEAGLSESELIKSVLANLNKSIEGIHIDELEGLGFPKVHLDFECAKTSEAIEAYERVGFEDSLVEKNKKIADLLRDIADERSEISKLLWRVENFSDRVKVFIREEEVQNQIKEIESKISQAKPDELEDFNAKLKELKECLEKEEKEILRLKKQIKFSYKSLLDLSLQDLIELARITDSNVRHKKIVDMVIKHRDKVIKIEAGETKKKIEVVYEIAKRGMKL